MYEKIVTGIEEHAMFVAGVRKGYQDITGGSRARWARIIGTCLCISRPARYRLRLARPTTTSATAIQKDMKYGQKRTAARYHLADSRLSFLQPLPFKRQNASSCCASGSPRRAATRKYCCVQSIVRQGVCYRQAIYRGKTDHSHLLVLLHPPPTVETLAHLVNGKHELRLAR